jgi:hypothetical protein
MFPFFTNKKSQFVNKQSAEVKALLETKIEKLILFEITDNSKFYGVVKSDYAIFELGQSPIHNAFRPIVKLKWETLNQKTKITTTYSLNKTLYLLLLIMPALGIYFSIQQGILTPFIITLIVYLLLIFVIIQLFYTFSKSRTTNLLNQLLKEINQTT